MAVAFALDDLIALNDEIAALVRSGVPLERGLLGFGGDVSGRLGIVARELGVRLEQGASLAEALAQAGPALPPTYKAVVEAGLRAGRLPAALEDVADYARGFADLRRVIGQSLLYPLIVLMMAYGLLLGALVAVIPRIREAFESFGLGGLGAARWLERIGGKAPIWGPILPLLVTLGLIGWFALGRARALDSTRSLRWVPWLRSAMDDWRISNFSGWLGLLIDHGVPLGRAMNLAGQASGDYQIVAMANRLSERDALGEPLADSIASAEGFPPLLRWLIGSGVERAAFVPALRHASELYHGRALRKAETMRVVLPTLLLIGIGGLATAIYALTVFLPWASLLNSLARKGM